MEQNITIRVADKDKRNKAHLAYADGSRYTTDKYIGCDDG
jgi:hypothetical protein